MKKTYIAPAQQVMNANLIQTILEISSIKVGGGLYEGGEQTGYIGTSTETVEDDVADTKSRGWDVFGGE